MSDHDTDPSEGGADRSRRDLLVALLLIEAASVMIGLIMPVTPSKTGSDWSPAEWIWPDPSYLQEAVVYYVITNVLLVGLAVGGWLALGRGDRGGAGGDRD